jgi:prepilin-type processing-associated H-X9-DG protein
MDDDTPGMNRMDENPYRGPHSGSDGVPKRRHRWGATLLKLLPAVCVIGFLIALLLPAWRSAGPTARRIQCANQLKQIALGLRSYAEVYHAWPPAYTVDADGKPLHSWRTLILPYIERMDVYKSIDLTKPWDDPANASARKLALDEYRCSAGSGPDSYTTYLAIVTPSSCLRAGEPRELSDITDDRSQTLLVIEVDTEHAVPWMSPVDADEQLVLSLGPKSKLAHAGGMNAVFVDGSGQFLPDDLPAADRRALISIAGNDKVPADDSD